MLHNHTWVIIEFFNVVQTSTQTQLILYNDCEDGIRAQNQIPAVKGRDKSNSILLNSPQRVPR